MPSAKGPGPPPRVYRYGRTPQRSAAIRFVEYMFDLDAKRAYAWSYERPDGKRRFFVVLHVGGITGPREPVRAAMVAEARRKQ